MERMDTDALHGKVTAAWVATYIRNPDPTLAELGDACLAALGLDDLDAATKRAAEAIGRYSGSAWQLYEGMASVILKAALTATEDTNG